MGNFYVNHTVRATDREKIGNVLANRDAFISPVLNGVVVIYDKEADLQDGEITVGLAKLLSSNLDAVVLATLNHDDDILAYWLFDRGTQTDSYNSSPDYFEATATPRGPLGGNAKVLCESFVSRNGETVERVLRSDDYAFASDRHSDLLKALGFTPELFLFGYNYLEAGEFPEGLSKNDFIEVGGKP